MSKVFIGLQLLLIPALIASAIFLASNREVKETTETRYTELEISYKTVLDIEVENINKITQAAAPSDIVVGGWIPDWDMNSGLESLENNPEFDYVSPVWFTLEEEGEIKETQLANGPGITRFTENEGIDLVPSILQLNVDKFSFVLSSEESMNKHVEDIMNLVNTNNYRGIDLDYEVIYLKDKKNFFKFLDRLSTRLHQNNKILTFAVLPIWYKSLRYTGSPQTRKVQDYAEMAKYVDELRIMTYDLFWTNSQVIGPVAPVNWLESSIKFAVANGVPREKIVLGVPTYSYDWASREIAGNQIEIYSPVAYSRTTEHEPGTPLYNNSVEVIKSKYEYTEEYNSSWQEMVLRYNFNGVNRVVVYPNEQSFQARKELASKYGIKGIAYWRLGDEGSLDL